MLFTSYNLYNKLKPIQYNRCVRRISDKSKRCHPCGYILDKLPLNIREWTCPSYNNLNLRDQNAALNILAVGQTVFASGLS